MSHLYDSSGVLLSRIKSMLEMGEAVWSDVAEG
jgi:hypothetical protein